MDTNGNSIVIRMGGIYITSNQEKGGLLQKHRDRNRIAILPDHQTLFSLFF